MLVHCLSLSLPLLHLRPMTLLLLFIFINGFWSFPVNGSKAMQFKLIHRHSAKVFSAPKTQLERIQELVRMDYHRIQMISRRLGKRRKDIEIESSDSSGSISLLSGAYSGTGQYFVRFRVGTPSQKFLLVADTGSDLTWINCHHHSRRTHSRRVFHAHHSSSFKTISCSSDMCQMTLPFSLAQCPIPETPCQYDYRYADGSRSRGIFANETVTVGLSSGRKMRLHNVVIGCSSTAEGSSFAASDGVLGLGYSNSSFVINARDKFGGIFSYCLVDHLSPKNVTSYLTFGHSRIKDNAGLSNVQYTQLVLNVSNGFYAVNVAGISIGGVMLNIPMNIWDVGGEGGMIIDSGTSLTILAEPAYRIVMNALKLPLIGFVKEVEMKPFEFCFESVGFNASLVPRLAIHFADSARLEPPVKSYVIDVSNGVKCLGFMPTDWPSVSIIGNIMQQNFLWEFDTVNKRLGFAPSSCVTDKI